MPAHEPIGRTDNVCPTCLMGLTKRPQRKSACPGCGAVIFVRTRPDDSAVVLVNDSGRRGLEAAKRAKAWIAAPFTADEAQTQLARLAAHRDNALKSAERLTDHAIAVAFVILTAPHACQAALAQVDQTYPPDALPSLPMPGCSLTPKCSCVISARVIDPDVGSVEP